jgi:hypothetical protein
MTNTTQTDLLDGVVPDGWLWRYVGNQNHPQKGELIARSFHEMNPENPSYPDTWEPVGGLISIKKVEAMLEDLLEANRKQVLLEAADIVGEVYERCKETEEAHYRLSIISFKMGSFGFNPSVVAYSHDKAEELRRMALEPTGVDKGEKE